MPVHELRLGSTHSSADSLSEFRQLHCLLRSGSEDPEEGLTETSQYQK